MLHISMTICQIPGIVLLGNILWFPNEFLQQYLPALCKTIDQKTMTNTTSSRLQWLNNMTSTLTK